MVIFLCTNAICADNNNTCRVNSYTKSTYFDNGQKESEIGFKEGLPDGNVTIWYKDGKIKLIGCYKNGVEEGLMTEFYPNGFKKREIFFKDGIKSGIYKTWHNNGKRKTEANFINNNLNGEYLSWYSNGSIELNATMKDGKLIKANGYNEDGSIMLNFKEELKLRKD